MKLQHFFMAVTVALIWGVNFVIIKVALTGFPPLLLTSLRFALASLPVLFLPKPNLRWRDMAFVSAFLFFGQYGFLFTGMKAGMPPGLASALLQMQAFLTILFAIFILREKPNTRQIYGSIIAFAGLGLMALGIGGDVTLLGFMLTFGSAVTFGLGNVLLRKSGGAGTNMLGFVGWMSLFPPLPLLALSYIFEGPEAIMASLQFDNPIALVSLIYIAGISTLVAFSMWGTLFRHYQAAQIAPFALLIPIFGAITSALVFQEQYSGPRLWGMVLVLVGVSVTVLTINRKTISLFERAKIAKKYLFPSNY